MSWGHSLSFPRAILHIDGDSFFASCEVAKNPALKGKPVITGKERGIVSAATYEAKAFGVKRGMMLSQVKKLCPEAIILPSDYETYSLFSNRMYEIVRRYTPAVEEYSIDECFADLGGMRRVNHMSYVVMAQRIKHELEEELGMTFSLGLSATKVLAKVASKWKKPAGLTIIPLNKSTPFLAQVPVGKLWGIGPNTAAFLYKHGVKTALQFTQKDEFWVGKNLSKPFFEVYKELKGQLVYELNTEGRDTYQSISKTKTFTPASVDPEFVFSQLSKNIENACIKARRWSLVAPQIFFFLKTQEFSYHGCEITLPQPTNVPQEILRQVSLQFSRVFKKGVRYRATGITLFKLFSNTEVQLDLFGSVKKSQSLVQVFESIDEISKRYGKHAVFLGSSVKAMQFGAHLGERGDMPIRNKALFKGESTRRRLPIPSLGEVS